MISVQVTCTLPFYEQRLAQELQDENHLYGK